MDLLTLILTIFLLGLLYYNYFYNPKKNIFDHLDIPYVKPLPFFGNIIPCLLRKLNYIELVTKLYNKFPNEKYFGMFDFQTPVIVIRDPEIIKSIGIKNFESFINHRGFTNESIDPIFGRSLFSLKDNQWREMRTILSPSFTSSKMKMMFNLMRNCAEKFTQALLEISTNDSQNIINLKDIFTKISADVISTCAFGINIDSMRDPKNNLYMIGRKATNFDGILSLKFLLIRNFKRLSKLFKITIFNSRVNRFFTNVISSNIKFRKEEGITRQDFLQWMMDFQDNKNENRKLSLEEITANVVLFFVGGLDAVSSALSFALHEITVNPGVQEKLQQEIDNVFENSPGHEPTYQDIMNMPYMDAVINEVLRLYPIGIVDRICNRKFELPPISSEKEPITVSPGMSITFPMFAIHRDSQYFENPEKFTPERFLNEKRVNASSATYFPFGIGPRICIGNRFALMEIKVVLFYLLVSLNFQSCCKTSVPIKFKKDCFLLLPEGGFWLKIEKRKFP
ncbi:cytochrome P450 9e2-like [Leptopilina heterotoma]|uniref:cytochrome P450 9e2-like n=1 Tax=Leptopilina heterotoma TaxID=63436 RepID=UPI001CA92410|nr:cytochrome P450 9e2-like [Leptopilina heterotoma]